MKDIIAIYPSHDASICIMTKDGNFRIFEIERLLKNRFASLLEDVNYKDTYYKIKEIIKKEYNIDSFDTCYYLHLNEQHKAYLKEIFNIQEFIETYHHESHAACSFYQSPFNEALIISYDGGGYDGYNDGTGFFNIYYGDKNKGIERIYRSDIDLGTSYGLMGIPISEIKKDKSQWGTNFLTFAGKLMGLVAYGEVKDKWIPKIEQIYTSHKSLEDSKFYGKLYKMIRAATKTTVNVNTLSEGDSYNLAATSQYVFEKIFFDRTQEYFDKYSHLPICLTGGCALNVILNQQLRYKFYPNRDIFIPPNPSDCGLAFGMIALHEKPQLPVNITYAGVPILDIDNIHQYISKYNAKKISLYDLAQLLYNGKIIGVMHGNSECGPRALGNRSILCNPGISDMKDILNAKVKFREWFRPFAPVVRAENVSKFFEFEGETPYMSYSPKVKHDWKDKLPAIVHKDGTARVQTVTESQNKFLYDLLIEFEKLSGYDVLLNTSFNIRGKPILTTIEDAVEVLETTEIDGVLIDGYLFAK